MKAVCYARFSNESQRTESITAQLREIYDYASKNDITIIKNYVDEAQSARSDDRDNFQLMIDELPIIQPDYVLVHKVDRFARNKYDAAYYRRAIKKAKARLIAVVQDFGEGPEAELIEGIMDGMAEYYSSNLSREVKKGHTENALSGRHIGGIPPLGLDLDKDKHYVINEAEAPAIRLIFSRKLEGKSYTEIQAELNAQGFRTKSGQPFGNNSLHDILRNEKYIGNLVIRKTSRGNSHKAFDSAKTMRIEGVIPAIIDQDTFNMVQDILNSATQKSHNEGQPMRYMLTGIIRCGICGGMMSGHTVRKAKGATTRGYYKCGRAHRSKDCANTLHYPKHKIEDAVLDKITQEIKSIKRIDRMAARMFKEIARRFDGQNDRQIDIKKSLHKAEQEFSNLTNAISAGADPRFLTDKINEAGQRREQLRHELELAGRQFDFNKQDIIDFLTRRKAIRYDRADDASCMLAINEAIKEVTVYPELIEIKLKGLV